MADSTEAWYLRPAQAISLWSQGAKERLPAVTQLKCFSSGVLNLPSRPCSQLPGSVQKACCLPGDECKTNCTPGAKFTPPAELAEMLFQMGQGRKPGQLSLPAMNSHPLILPGEHSATPTFGAAGGLQAKPEAGTEHVHRPQPPFTVGRDIPVLQSLEPLTDHIKGGHRSSLLCPCLKQQQHNKKPCEQKGWRSSHSKVSSLGASLDIKLLMWTVLLMYRVANTWRWCKVLVIAT